MKTKFRMAQNGFTILTINAGSSSIKFSLYSDNKKPELLLVGKIEKIGTTTSSFEHKATGKHPVHKIITAKNISEAAILLIDWVENNIGFNKVSAAGHRIVHGMNHVRPVIISDLILAELQSITKYDPDHLPGAIMLIKKIAEKQPGLQQVACFDTSFHATLPRVAQMLPLPRRFEDEGIRRFGFHGISYAYLMEKLVSIAGVKIANGRLILAHLGSGASLAAVKDGKCMDTSMGFTPAGGFMMGTRTGDLDPGILSFLLQEDKITAKDVDSIVNHESGLLGVSGTSADMGDLLKNEKADKRAAEAIALFCYQVKKTLCAYTGVLGGLDTIVFTGGIGENAFQVRSKICAGLDFLGIHLDEKVNQQNDLLISAPESKVTVYVIPANEESMIAKYTIALLKEQAEENNK